MVTEQNIIHLIDLVSSIRKRYEKVAEATGENFNIFRILRLESQEVKHSRLLGELLNPKGSHGQGHIFLKLFFQQFEIAMEAESAVIEIEKYVGAKTESNGGYIDILITDNQKRRIIIENKIYAGDQENQLVRYHGYDTNADIIYLTLHGSDPDIDRLRHQNIHKKLKLVSYKTEIIKWLEDCRKEAAVHPILRETLTQYINALKLLTGQSTNEVMNNEVVEKLAQNIDNVKSVYLINSLILELQGKLIEEARLDILKIGKEKDLVVICEEKWKSPYSEYKGFYFKRPDWKFCLIGFEIEDHNLFYGIKSQYGTQIPEDLRLKIRERLPTNEEPNEWWLYWEWLENGNWRNNPSFYIEIKNGTFSKKVENILTKILENSSDLPL